MKTSSATLFPGWQLGWDSVGLVVDEVLMAGEVFAGHDEHGARYVMAHTATSTWLCAPISERALECVASGRAELRAVFAHSATGTVERVTVRGDAVCDQLRVPCAELHDDVLPRPGVRLCWPARCA